MPLTPSGKNLSRRGLSVQRDGEVYFAQAVTMGLIKIGFARDLYGRLAALRVSSPDEIKLLGVIRTDDPCRLEAEMHAHFAADLVRGEWFRPSAALLSYIANHAQSEAEAFFDPVRDALARMARA